MDHWKSIWENRVDKLDNLGLSDVKAVFAELKRVDGFDLEGGLPLESLLGQYESMKEELCLQKGDSVFEVGCGAGANLYLLAREGYAVGGIDYSQHLLDIMRKAMPDVSLRECICDEAVHVPVEIVYDVVFSNSVFAYFRDLAYAEAVLERMLKKAGKSIGILDVYDEARYEECLEYRRKTIENYEERYKDLPKLAYPRSFFETFAGKHGLSIHFSEAAMEGYGNSEFVFHCYMQR